MIDLMNFRASNDIEQYIEVDTLLREPFHER